MFSDLYQFFKGLLKLLIIYMPGNAGYKIRNYYYKKSLKSIGKNVKIDVGVLIEGESLISIGDNVHIDKYCVISTGCDVKGRIFSTSKEKHVVKKGEIIIGNNVHIVHNCILMGYGGIQLEDNVVISAGSKIYSLTNTPSNPEFPSEVISIVPYDQAPFLLGAVTLAENVWLGLNVIIMPGVYIGKNSFVVSNSLVLKSTEENSYMVGQPAIYKKKRFNLTDP